MRRLEPIEPVLFASGWFILLIVFAMDSGLCFAQDHTDSPQGQVGSQTLAGRQNQLQQYRSLFATLGVDLDRATKLAEALDSMASQERDEVLARLTVWQKEVENNPQAGQELGRRFSKLVDSSQSNTLARSTIILNTQLKHEVTKDVRVGGVTVPAMTVPNSLSDQKLDGCSAFDYARAIVQKPNSANHGKMDWGIESRSTIDLTGSFETQNLAQAQGLTKGTPLQEVKQAWGGCPTQTISGANAPAAKRGLACALEETWGSSSQNRWMVICHYKEPVIGGNAKNGNSTVGGAGKGK